MDSDDRNALIVSLKSGIPKTQELYELAKILFFQDTNVLAHSLAVLVTAWFLWDAVPKLLIMLWVSVMLGQSIYWQMYVLRYRRTNPPTEETQTWMRYYVIAGATIGSGWGATALFPTVLEDPSTMIFLAIMVLGVVTAALSTFAAYLRSYLLLIGCALMPFVVQFLLAGDRLHSTLAGMFLLYIFAIVLSGKNMRSAVLNTIALRFENIELIKDLKIRHNHAEHSQHLAEQANRSKSKFLAAASHDLRQPLHALGLFVDVLESRISYPEVRSIVDNIKISTDALAELFNALLDISKLDAGILEPELEDIPLEPVLQRMLTDYSDWAKRKGISLRFRDCHATIRSDPAMFDRILRNLVSNAVRYTQSGGVLVGCRRYGDSLKIDVYDTGVGIEPDKQAKVFEEFYQVENPERDRRKGLGLGLAIVRRLCQLLKIHIEVNSIPQRGTRFRITVPIVTATTECESPLLTTNADVNNKQVLIIDDEVIIRIGMQELLGSWGCKVELADSASQALEVMTAQHFMPDLIVSDYRLREDNNGIEAIELIRTHFNKSIPAILVTGDTAPDRLREAKDSGLQILHKPVSPAKLRALMSYLLERSENIKM